MEETDRSFPSLVRQHLAPLPAYTPIEPFEVLSERLGREPEEIVKLDANENPYGPSPAVREALTGLRFPHIYPDPESRALRSALADFTGAPLELLMAGSGADELIDMLLRAVLDPDDCVLSCPPTFGMYAFDTRVNAGRAVEVLRGPNFSVNLGAIRQAVKDYRPKVLFLAVPNNPDGSMPLAGLVEALLDLPLLVVLDEAYIEFCDQGVLGEMATRIQAVEKHDNLVVLRTFSKWAGLAGLRIGYAAFPAWLMPTLWKAKQPYNVNVAASAAAIASLNDAPYLAQVVSRLRLERQRLFEGLSRIPYLEPYPSQANFILSKVTGWDAFELKQFLSAQHGILVR
jgi:histidinol-phosphate aminotransferase